MKDKKMAWIVAAVAVLCLAFPAVKLLKKR